jgi:hypothetical protein
MRGAAIMKCNAIEDKLPEYLAGTLTDDLREEVSMHLSTCDKCMKKMIEMEAVMLENLNASNEIEDNNAFNKAKRKFIIKICKLTILSIAVFVLLVFLVIPGIFSSIRMMQYDKYSRAFTDLVQFSYPVQVGGYGNSFNANPYQTIIKVYANEYVGNRIKGESKEISSKLNFITGRFESPVEIGTAFTHPDIDGSGADDKKSIKNAIKILENNSNNTVAVTDISLKRFISLKDVSELLKKYDVKVLWMAIECGYEKIKPKNMSGLNQYIMWGIPQKLYSYPNKHIELTADNTKEFENRVVEEMSWLDNNKNPIIADKELLRNNGIDNSVGKKAAYIVKNGIKVYGVRITGPTKEILRLQKEINTRNENVVDIGFWFWE